MFNFTFALTWPSKKDRTLVGNMLAGKRGLVGEHKAWEANFYRRNWRELFAIRIDFTPTGRSHAGFYASLTILGFEAEVEFYDRRHWNYDAERFCTPEESEEW